MTDDGSVQSQRPPLSSAKYTLKGHVVHREAPAGLAKPMAHGVMGDFRQVEESKDGSKPK